MELSDTEIGDLEFSESENDCVSCSNESSTFAFKFRAAFNRHEKAFDRIFPIKRFFSRKELTTLVSNVQKQIDEGGENLCKSTDAKVREAMISSDSLCVGRELVAMASFRPYPWAPCRGSSPYVQVTTA